MENSDKFVADIKDRETLIDRVQKLLDVAESTAFPEEAKTFREKAADLMAKHAIENSEFEGTQQYMIVNLEFDEDPTVWQIHNVNAISKFNGMLCIIWTSLGKKSIRLVGTPGDHAAFTYMYDSVLRQMGTALCNFMDKENKYTTTNRTRFMVGFSYGLADKVRNLMEARNTKIQQYGLVPINETQKVRNWYEQKEGKLSKGKASSAKYENAGINAGKNASLNKGVSSNSFANRLQLA